jgi:hypothetical protein
VTYEQILKLSPAALARKADAVRCNQPECEACARYPQGGPTARWIQPAKDTTGSGARVTCPTCGDSVLLREWWNVEYHRCRALPRCAAEDRGTVKVPSSRGSRWQYWGHARNR